MPNSSESILETIPKLRAILVRQMNGPFHHPPYRIMNLIKKARKQTSKEKKYEKTGKYCGILVVEVERAPTLNCFHNPRSCHSS